MVPLKKLLTDNTDVFVLNDEKLGCTGLVQHVIKIGSHFQIKQLPHHTLFAQCEKIAKMFYDRKDRGIVKSSTSPWACPVILVPKRDGTSHFCINYQRLNLMPSI